MPEKGHICMEVRNLVVEVELAGAGPRPVAAKLTQYGHCESLQFKPL
jgi:hypothetical protein